MSALMLPPCFALFWDLISLISGITAGVIGLERGRGGGGTFSDAEGFEEIPGLGGVESVFFMWVYFGDKYLDEIPFAISLLDNKGPRFLERNRAFNCLFLFWRWHTTMPNPTIPISITTAKTTKARDNSKGYEASRNFCN